MTPVGRLTIVPESILLFIGGQTSFAGRLRVSRSHFMLEAFRLMLRESRCARVHWQAVRLELHPKQRCTGYDGRDFLTDAWAIDLEIEPQIRSTVENA